MLNPPINHSPQYRPTAPPKPARRLAALRQALHLPKTLLAIYTIVRQDFETAALDEYLWAFWGFHHQPWDPHYRMRPWQKAQLRAIEPRDVVGLAMWEMALMLNMAMEDEEPILEYTQQSGEGFRFLLPALGRFMGKSEEQARYTAEHNVAWCEGPWCAEERRHSNTLARIIERLMKVPPARDNPNKPMIVTADEEAAVRHLISRQTSEWNASSSYVIMAAHAVGELHTLIRNLARDEIKHLSIMSAASSYLFGPRPWGRFFELVKKGLENYTSQKKSRSGGDLLGTNAITAMEGITAHLLTEYYVRKWLRTVPLHTLATVFETPSSLPELDAFAPSPQRQAEIDETLRKGKAARVSLARWAPEQRRKALDQRSFEESSEAIIDNIKMRNPIKRFCSPMLRNALRNRLRDHQIQNNRHVLARGSGAGQVRRVAGGRSV
jgi:hypothetical protein